MIKDKVVKLIAIDGSTVTAEQGELIDTIIELTTEKVMSLLPSSIESLPTALNWVVVEMSVRRYNRIGSEGMTSEGVEGHSVNFGSNDDLEDYRQAIEGYVQSLETGKARVVRFL